MSLNLDWNTCPNPDTENGFTMAMYMMIVGVNKLDDKGIEKFKERVGMLRKVDMPMANYIDSRGGRVGWYPLDDEYLAGWAGARSNTSNMSDAKWERAFYKMVKDASSERVSVK